MSSDRRSGDPSSGPEPDLAALVRERGSALLDGLEDHRPGSREHADGTASYAFAASVELGLDRRGADAIREAARLHEIGKVYVPADVLAKSPEELAPEQQALLGTHFALGAELARGAGVPDQVCEWIRASAERFDGDGPTGLGGERIPLQSRIARVACTCDAVLAAPPEPGGEAPLRRRDRAIAELSVAAGRELDPRVVEALGAVLERAASPRRPGDLA